MTVREADIWMWSEACEMLSRAERLHRQFFQLQRSHARVPAWEPPADVVETAREVLVFVALPGVNVERVEAAIEDGALVIAGRRELPPELRDAVIHRLELPQGRFERKIPLPPGRYDRVQRTAIDGCLVIRLQKAL
jgi:HSP20 family molecular chaperone IbpA